MQKIAVICQEVYYNTWWLQSLSTKEKKNT